MSKVTRRNMMVHHFGYSHDQVDVAAKSTRKIKKQREETKALTAAKERRQERTEAMIAKMKRLSLSKEDKLILNHSRRNCIQEEDDQMNQLLMLVR